jgi:flagellar basal body-associated protein FliL
MGTEKAKPREGEAEAAPSTTPVAPKGKFRDMITRSWLVLVILLGTILLQVGALVYHRATAQAEQPRPSPEMELGVFHFDTNRADEGQTTHADFAVCLALQDSNEQASRQRLATHKYRVQQEIEELLRKAHCGDFDDPSLRDLKRQCREQINQVLGLQGVCEVIITDLRIQRAPASKAPLSSTAEAEPKQDRLRP